jgi:RNA polymerase sigma factor (sigma-70 family)
MKTEQDRGSGALVERHYTLIREAVTSHARRHRLDEEEHEELFSYSLEKLLERERKVFGCFRGRSSLRTYLESIVGRLWVDLLNKWHGRWRPMASSSRLGTTVVALDQLVRRDRQGVRTAVRLVQALRPSKRSAETLEAIGVKLAAVVRPREIHSQVLLSHQVARERADEQLEEEQRGKLADRFLQATREAIAGLPDGHRQVVHLWFFEGRSAPQIAELTGLAPKKIYRLITASLKKLATDLEARGLGRESLRWVVDPERPSFLPAGSLAGPPL